MPTCIYCLSEYILPEYPLRRFLSPVEGAMLIPTNLFEEIAFYASVATEVSEGSMRFGTVSLQGNAGKHTDLDGQECSGRTFRVNSVGIGGIYTNRVRCLTCLRELTAYENGLAEPQSTTFVEALRQSASPQE
jgi:hypothetical protein